jgi:predicted naringenin-chalcone synthase
LPQDKRTRRTSQLFEHDERRSLALKRMIERGGIEHRYSFLKPADVSGAALDADAFYMRGHFPNTAARMRLFEMQAPELAAATIARLKLGADRNRISHLIITSCTGLSAPGIDLDVIERCQLPTSVERTMIGFMGCYAAINALKLARHIVRSEPTSRVLVINLELCTLHFQETTDLEQVLCFLLFSDGCAAYVVTAEPQGIALRDFKTMIFPNTRELMAWNIRDFGFDMVLSGGVPAAINDAIRARSIEIFAAALPEASIDLWAIHPGGRTILDAVQAALRLPPVALAASRRVLRLYGNMSSATVMFVMDELMRSAAPGAHGCAMSFGPGLVAEMMMFHIVGQQAGLG